MWRPAFYDQPSFGRTRDSMPQIDYQDIDSYLIHFANKAKVHKHTTPLNKLKPAQKDIDLSKLADKMIRNSDEWKSRKYICSKDNYIIDGHHDYAHGLEQDPEFEVTVYKVNLPVKELLRRSSLLKFSYHKDLADKLIESVLGR